MNKYKPLLLLPMLAFLAFIASRMHEADVTSAEAATQAALEASAEPVAQPSASRSATLKLEGGHYWADARVNNSPVHFLVDTGASVVALTKEDARRAGINVKALQETARMSTANGEIAVPVATLRRIRIGNVEVTNVRAVVIEEGLDTSLLGMSFLGKLKSWQMTPAGLVLKQ